MSTYYIMYGISLSDENKILILILLVGIVMYLFTSYYKINITKEDMVSQESLDPVLSNNFNDYVDIDPNDSKTFDNLSTESSQISSKSIDSENSNYKNVSYAKGNRLNKSSDLDKFFEGSYPTKNDTNAFNPSLETSDQYASYTSNTSDKKLTVKDKFDSSALLPREKNSEWFDDPFEQVASKSPHLINIYRPIGVESIQTTKARSHDIREVPPNPKYPVSPFGNSSWEPDTNISDHALCA